MNVTFGSLWLPISLLEYYILAALVLSPHGGSGTPEDAKRLQLAFVRGAALGPAVCCSAVPNVMAVFLALQAHQLTPDQHTNLLLATSLLTLVGLFVFYLLARGTLARLYALLQRLGRALLVHAQTSVTLAVLGPILGFGTLSACFRMAFAFHFADRVNQMRQDDDVSSIALLFMAPPSWDAVWSAAVSFGGFLVAALGGIALLAALARYLLRSSPPACAHAVTSDEWLARALYRGCPVCQTLPTRSLAL
jgi:hypothetical protein